MKDNLSEKSLPLDDWDCFGQYDPYDPVCSRWCVLRLGCCVDKEKNGQMELLEQFFHSANPNATIQ